MVVEDTHEGRIKGNIISFKLYRSRKNPITEIVGETGVSRTRMYWEKGKSIC